MLDSTVSPRSSEHFRRMIVQISAKSKLTRKYIFWGVIHTYTRMVCKYPRIGYLATEYPLDVKSGSGENPVLEFLNLLWG